MQYTDFKYIDVAIGGATKRNNVVELTELRIPENAADTYTTMFRFREEYREHVETTGSVRGADQFECWSDWLWFDIDADSLDDATADMQALLRGIESMGVLDKTVVFFSGSKGYHVGIDSGVFGFKPSQALPEKMRHTCIQIASLLSIDIDVKIYNHNRLWRVTNTVHSKTKLRKTALDPKKAIELTVDKIKRIAASSKNRKNRQYLLCDNAAPVESLVRLAKEANTGMVKKSGDWEAPPVSGKHAQSIQAGLDYLLTRGVGRGERDNETLLRASECRKLGIDQTDCLSKLVEWNAKNTPPLEIADLERVVSSAYTGDGYDFGTNHDSLRVARDYGHKMSEVIDVSKLLNEDNNKDADDKKYKRRPYTVAELLSDDYQPEELNMVGEYFSWRKRITLLVGREKSSGKSTLCTFEAMAALRKGHRVLWISPDEPQDDILYRFIKAGIQPYADNCIIAGDMNVPIEWEELGHFIADTRPDLIILDSIHSLLPILNRAGKVPDASETHEWQKLVSCLRPLAIKLDAAVIWIHHANKATGTSTGSVGITAGVDAIVTVWPCGKQKPNRRKLVYLGRRVGVHLNCAVDYLDEERGFERAKDWNKDVDSEKSKTELAVVWLEAYISAVDGDEFVRTDAAEAYREYFNDSPDSGSFAAALVTMRERGVLGKGKPKVVRGPMWYPILAGMKPKISDLIKDEDDEE